MDWYAPSAITLYDSPPGAISPIEEVSGLFTYAVEEISLAPEGVAEKWWVVPNDGLRAALDAWDEDYYVSRVPVRVRMKGRKTELGQYGHLGQYERMFYISQLLEIRPLPEKSAPK